MFDRNEHPLETPVNWHDAKIILAIVVIAVVLGVPIVSYLLYKNDTTARYPKYLSEGLKIDVAFYHDGIREAGEIDLTRLDKGLEPDTSLAYGLLSFTDNWDNRRHDRQLIAFALRKRYMASRSQSVTSTSATSPPAH